MTSIGETIKALFGKDVERVGPPYTHTFTPPADQFSDELDENGEPVWVGPPDPTMATYFFTEAKSVIRTEREPLEIDLRWEHDEFVVEGRDDILVIGWWEASFPMGDYKYQRKHPWEAVFAAVEGFIKQASWSVGP